MDTWREGPARLYDPADECPKCGPVGRIAFASDFKKFGAHKIRCCVVCCKCYDGTKETGHLVVHKGGP